jgi:hypothetical protein
MIWTDARIERHGMGMDVGPASVECYLRRPHEFRVVFLPSRLRMVGHRPFAQTVVSLHRLTVRHPCPDRVSEPGQSVQPERHCDLLWSGNARY